MSVRSSVGCAAGLQRASHARTDPMSRGAAMPAASATPFVRVIDGDAHDGRTSEDRASRGLFPTGLAATRFRCASPGEASALAAARWSSGRVLPHSERSSRFLRRRTAGHSYRRVRSRLRMPSSRMTARNAIRRGMGDRWMPSMERDSASSMRIGAWSAMTWATTR